MITKSVVLACAPHRAFELFTERASEWWPPERRHTKDPSSTITMSREGRFFERDVSGREVELGVVRAWEPGRRVLLDWYPGTDAEHPTEVEIAFVAEGDRTRVEVRHGPTDRSADLFEARAPRYVASWDLVLSALSGAVDAT